MILGEVAKFGGNWPGENGMAKTWNVPMYKVDFSRAAAAAIGDRSGGIDEDAISTGRACPSSNAGFDPSVICKPLKSSANAMD